tara:strand:- start:396 stop:980 length:585 start_codon:yes stop_codon:yes gene_type:complete
MMVGENTGAPFTVMRVPENTVGVEIGVWKGDSSAKFLDRNLKHLHLVDSWSPTTWFDKLDAMGKEKAIQRYKGIMKEATRQGMVDLYEEVASGVSARFEQCDNVTIHRMESRDWFAKSIEEGVMYDWVYVDGDHTFEGCLRDLNLCLKVIKTGGHLFADDYTNKPSVKKAIDLFAKENGFKFDIYGVNQVQIFI